MNKIVLMTDTNADVSEKYKNKIVYVPQYFKFENDDEYCENMDREIFYNRLKSEKVITSAPNPDLIYLKMKELIISGNDIVCISFSSKMSSTYNLFRLAAEDIKTDLSEYNPKIEVIDSLNAGPGQGMICADAIDLIESGVSFEDVVASVKNNLDRYKVYFIVNDFTYLVQGGRVSQATANLGKMFNIKPILNIKDGSIQSIAKPRGLKNAFDAIKNYIGEEYEKIWFIEASDAEVMKDFKTFIKTELKDETIETIPLNLITCSHLGPDAAALIVKK